jgi:ubiquitin-conjugating enzyme E2 E
MIFVCADTPLVMSISRQYLTDRAKHDETAAEWTMRFAR